MVHANQIVSIGSHRLVLDVGEYFVVHNAILSEGNLLEGGSKEGNKEDHEQGNNKASDEYFPSIFHDDSNIININDKLQYQHMKASPVNISSLYFNRSQIQSLSPKHKRVDENRKINEINWAIESLLTRGKLQKMELISINNRVLNNRGKIKRNEWLNKHKNLQSTFLPDIPHIQLDNRSEPKKRYQTEPEKKEKQVKFSDNWEKLIDDEIQVLKKKGVLNGQYNKSKVIQEACDRIKKKMKKAEKKRQQPKIQQQLLMGFQRKKSVHKRAITDAIYNESIVMIHKKQSALLKERELKKKLFLRKIKHISYTKPHKSIK